MTGDMRKEAVTRAAASTMKVKAPLMGYVVSYGIIWICGIIPHDDQGKCFGIITGYDQEHKHHMEHYHRVHLKRLNFDR